MVLLIVNSPPIGRMGTTRFPFDFTCLIFNYCNAGKIFAAHDILNWHQRPTQEELTNILSQFSCPCTDSITLANGIWYAIANKHKRENKRDKNER